MSDTTGTDRSWIRRVVDTVRWIAASEDLPPSGATGAERPSSGGADRGARWGSTVAADDRRSWMPEAVVWLVSPDTLPERPDGGDDGMRDLRRRSSRGWIRWLFGREVLPSTPTTSGDTRRTGGLLAWLAEPETLPGSAGVTQGEERGRGH